MTEAMRDPRTARRKAVAGLAGSSRAILAVAAVILAVACGDTGTEQPTALRTLDVRANDGCYALDVQPDGFHSIQAGFTYRYTARYYNCLDGGWHNNVQATWTSSNTSVATVAAGGNILTGFYADATGVGAGTALIQATYGGQTGQEQLTVTAAPFGTVLSGPTTIARYQSAQYTSTPNAAGTPPYTYSWRNRSGFNSTNYGAWSSWTTPSSTNYTYFSVNTCGIGAAQVESRVVDAVHDTATGSISISISNPC
jgi:hypothetical protein